MFFRFLTGVCGILLFASLLLPVTAIAQETRFVSPSISVGVRRGQGTEFKIIKLVKDGDQVEFLSENGDWAKVKIGTATGWMPARFLSTTAPPFKLVDILRSENEELNKENSTLNLQLAELKDLQNNTGNDLSTCIAHRDEAQSSFQKLKDATADVVAINNKLAATETEIKEVRSLLSTVQKKNNELEQKETVTWFLAGGGVLFLGWLIGLITGRSKRKRTSLM